MEYNIDENTSDLLISMQTHEPNVKSEPFDRNFADSCSNSFIESERLPQVAQSQVIKLERDIMPVKNETDLALVQKIEPDLLISGENCEKSVLILKHEFDLKNEPLDINVQPNIPLDPVLKFETDIVPVKYKADLIPVQKFETDPLVPGQNCVSSVVTPVLKHEVDDDNNGNNSNICDDFSSINFQSSPQYARSEEKNIRNGSSDNILVEIKQNCIRKIPKVILVDCLKNGTKTRNRYFKSSIKYDRPKVLYNNQTSNCVSRVCSKPSSSNGNTKIQESILLGRKIYHSSLLEDACQKAYGFPSKIKSSKHLNKTNLLVEENSFGIPKTINKGRNTVVKNYECIKSHKISCQTPALLQHIDNVHERVKYECKKCHKLFTRKFDLLRHINSVHEGVKYECDVCNKLFCEKSNLRKHINSVHEGVKYECDVCKKLFCEKSYLHKHIISVHEGVKYECDVCNKLFCDKAYLQKHINSVHEGVKYECNMCHKFFCEKSYLLCHIISIHKGIWKCECKICHKLFTRKSDLLRHINSVHEGVKYKCNTCHKLFSVKSSLLHHINSVHKGIK